MFGLFKSRKKYNGVVDVKVNSDYRIQTRDNPYFPGVLAYLDLLDNAWNTKMSEDEAAVYIATLYFCGLCRENHIEQARLLLSRINEVSAGKRSEGKIKDSRWSKFSKAIEESKVSVNI